MRLARTIAAAFIILMPHMALAQSGEDAQSPPNPAEAAEAEDGASNAATERPEVLYDPGLLPEPVRRMRERIIEAALSGDPEKMRAPIESNEMPPVFSFSEEAGSDPIEGLKKTSSDGTGLEIMAILSEVLEAGYVHVDKGTPQEMYVWPYFAQYPITELTPAQTVELYKLVTFYDLEQMKEFGAYNFYRVGIAPDGVWHFFVAGD
ncbi:hypothetical protein [Terrihabitans sp. B22-R8]|uniref:hypothetical protein n=1 Tax=Terrihabitans sp. B22-R8 TaxID=3425128 RepID=UPI00403C9941